jgi:hypothetical protein
MVPFSSPILAEDVPQTVSIDTDSGSGITVTEINPAPKSELPVRDAPIHPSPESNPNRPEREAVRPAPPALDREAAAPGVRIELLVEPAAASFSGSYVTLTVQSETNDATTVTVPIAQSLKYLEHLLTEEETSSLIEKLVQHYNRDSRKRSFIECIRDARYSSNSLPIFP